MADIKISAATDIATLVATDMMPVARSGSSTAYKATMAEISALTNTTLPVASTSVSGTVKVDGTSVTIAGGVISSAAAPPSSAAPPLMDGTAAAGAATAWSRGDHVHPSDTSRAPLASPTFTGTPASTTPTTGDSTTRIATTAFVQAQMVASGAGVSTWNTRAGAVVLQQADIAAVGALHDIGRNLLHNPLFNVAQRGAGPWTVSGYTTDRWSFATTLDVSTIQQFAATDAMRAGIGDEAANNIMTGSVAGNVGAGSYSFIYQPVEDVRRLAGKTITISFWAVANAATPKLGVSLTQNFGTGGSPSADVIINGQSVTVSTTWARYSLTFTVPSVAGKTLGTNNNSLTSVAFWFSAGATQNVRAGNIGVQTWNPNLWGMQLEIGSQATPLEKPDQRYDLSNCQRFFCLFPVLVPVASGASNLVLPVTMRAGPTITGGGAGFVSSNLSVAAVTVSQTTAAAQTLTFSADL